MRRRPRLLVLAAVVAGVLASCGGARDVAADPRAALGDAFDEMASWQGAEVVLRVDTDPDALVSLDDSGELTADQARAVLDGRVVLRGYTGPDVADRSDDRAEVLVETGSTAVLHLVTVGSQELYVRSDVDEVVGRFAGPEAADELAGMKAQAAQSGIGFADEFFAGEWLVLRGVDDLTEMYGAMAGVETPEPEELESLRGELSGLFEGFLEEVDIDYVGTDEVGDHLRVVATTEELGELALGVLDRMGELAAVQAGVPPDVVAEELRRELGDAPDVEVPVEVWISGGSVRRIGFDVVEFARRNGEVGELDVPQDVERFLLVADLAEFDGAVALPDDPIEVDLMELMGRFMGQGFGDLGGA